MKASFFILFTYIDTGSKQRDKQFSRVSTNSNELSLGVKDVRIPILRTLFGITNSIKTNNHRE